MEITVTKESLHEVLEVEIHEDIYDRILAVCERGEGSLMFDDAPFYSMFRHLIIIMGEDMVKDWINGCIEYFTENGGKGVERLFPLLHKNFRQLDMYEGFVNSKHKEDYFKREEAEINERKLGPSGIDGNLDMLMYHLINASNIPYFIIRDSVVSEHNIDKWRVLKRELKVEENE